MSVALSYSPLSPQRAREVTDLIRGTAGRLWELVVEAYARRAWVALEYASWDDYCASEFGTSRLTIPREERAEVVRSLRTSGLSLRAIEAATGVSERTARRELSGAADAAPEPAPVKGLDGKIYTPAPRPELTPEQQREADRAAFIRRARGYLEQLADGWTYFQGLPERAEYPEILQGLTPDDRELIEHIRHVWELTR